MEVGERAQLLIAALIGETASALDHVRSGVGEVPEGMEDRLSRQLATFSGLWPGVSTEPDRVVVEAREFCTQHLAQLNELLSDERVGE